MMEDAFRLSEEYGTSFQSAVSVMVNFLLKVLLNDSISYEMTEKIFNEILNNSPSNKEQKSIGILILQTSTYLIGNKSISAREKIVKLTDSLKDN
jgi:hypothetical protein